MTQRLDVVILAAGQGKRMRSAVPKVLHPLAGRPLLAHVIDTARELKPSLLCVVYGQGGDAVLRAFAAAKDLVFVRQERQLGTGHAVKQALPHLGRQGLTLVLYGDVPLVSAKTLRRMLRGRKERVAVLTAITDTAHGYGRILRDAKGAITGIVEEKDATEAQRRIREINSGIMAVPSRCLPKWLSRLSNRNAQGEYYLTDVVALALADGVEVAAVPAESMMEVLGVNSRAQCAQLERIVQERIAERLLDEGVTVVDPKRLDVRGTLQCGRDVRIDVNCVFEGIVQLADDVQIGANCVIKDTAIAAGTRVAPFSWIDGARIGARCLIGPFARIRPKTTLAADVHVGNFVEVKASDIATGSKANHLTYIGDSSIGKNVNVGAGTITCNYDGVNKHRTTIGDDAFIGSNAALVAPVIIGSGATIGAGSVIAKEAPAGQLTLTRAKQVTIAGWTRPRKATKAASAK